jgi:hypothetical protein
MWVVLPVSLSFVPDSLTLSREVSRVNLVVYKLTYVSPDVVLR